MPEAKEVLNKILLHEWTRNTVNDILNIKANITHNHFTRKKCQKFHISLGWVLDYESLTTFYYHVNNWQVDCKLFYFLKENL